MNAEKKKKTRISNKDYKIIEIKSMGWKTYMRDVVKLSEERGRLCGFFVYTVIRGRTRKMHFLGENRKFRPHVEMPKSVRDIQRNVKGDKIGFFGFRKGKYLVIFPNGTRLETEDRDQAYDALMSKLPLSPGTYKS